MRKTFALLLLMGVLLPAFSQDESEWKPTTHITGYVNTLFEYSDLVNGHDVLEKKEPAIGLSEAAFLVSYKPLKQMEFKGTFVYTHYIDAIQSLLVEAYGTYKINDALKISAGKYLTPLSPVNQYFYAPLNLSATLPMLVSHYTLLPQSISGFQISGEMGDNIRLGYNFTYGSYRLQGSFPGGMLGLIGRETANIYVWTYTGTANNFMGGSGRVYTRMGDWLNVGLNYFDGTKSRYGYLDLSKSASVTQYTPSKRYAAGIDMELNYKGLKLSGEYWLGANKTTDLSTPLELKFNSYYAECSYSAGIFSPFVRYEQNDDTWTAIYTKFPDSELFEIQAPVKAYTFGLAIRPIYEVLLKMEYRFLDTDLEYKNVNIPVSMQTMFPPENPLNITADKFNHIVLSLVYSF